MTFLRETAQYIFAQHAVQDLRKQCVILPTRRAVYYFKQELAKQSSVPFLAPEVLAVDDFFMKLSGKKLVDPIDLLFQLYDVFKEIDPKVELDKFAAWAPTLLKDFDSIDLYLISPKEIFSYISEARLIAKWNLDLLEANKAPLEKTARMDKFFKLFENLLTVYKALQRKLIEQDLAYRGMAYRLVAENSEEFILNNTTHEKFYFLGFNALSASEEKVIETLMKAQKAEILWDSDKYYMTTRNKAGDFLRNYRNSQRFGKWNWMSDNLLTQAKDIQIIGVPSNTLQAKVAGQLYSDMLKTNATTETAIVLSDENLLLPVMYSLDENINDFNITMGLSLRNSMLFSFVESIFELQQNMATFKSKAGETIKIPKFSHRHIAKVLNHPFVRRYEQNFTDEKDQVNSPIRQILNEIVEKNLVYLSESEIMGIAADEALVKTLFKRWGDDPNKAMACFEEVIEILRSFYTDTQEAIELEYLYLFYTILNRLKTILKDRKDVKLRSFKTFLFEFIKQTKIPFSGEPIAQLQIMGMLETRCLDFERLIILSVNETILPAGKKSNSLIPVDAALELGLPIYSQQDSVMAYHFFRLLQRAKQIDILYVLPSGDGMGGGGEKSRFIQLLEYELAKLNPKISISKPQIKFIQNTDSQEINSVIEIQKTPDILEKIRSILTEKGIYPSHLNQYIKCTLQYYFAQIAQVAEQEEIGETFGADVFGNWIHLTLEAIDKEYGANGRLFTEEDVKKVIEEIPDRLQKVYEEQFRGFVVESGMNFLLKQVAEKLLTDFFKEQLKQGTYPLQVLSVEKKLVASFSSPVLEKVQMAGRIDRIELRDNILKVVDYKTGKVVASDLTLDKDQTWKEALLFDSSKEKLRQMWLYQYLMLKQLNTENGLKLGGKNLHAKEYEVRTKIYSFRNLKEKLETSIHLDGNADFITETESLLSSFVEEILSPEIPFSQTIELENCEFCNFREICRR